MATVTLWPVLPMYLSGPIRSATGASPWLALAAGTLVAALVTAPLLPTLFRLPPAWSSMLSHMVPALAVALALRELNNEWYDGLPTMGGTDAGRHVAFARSFALDVPNEYYGCVAFYALTLWIERLGYDVFEAFRSVYFFNVGVVVGLPLILSLVAVHGRNVSAQVVGAAVALLAMASVQPAFLLPVLSYHQADGYYTHLLSVVPLMGAWFIDVAIRPRWLRIFGLIGCAVLLRYTYVLNLGDFLIAIAALLALEAATDRSARGWLLATSVLLAGIAALVFRRLLAVLAAHGNILRADELEVRVGLGLVIVALGARAFLARLSRAQAEETFRLVRLPLCFTLASLSASTILGGVSSAPSYYLAKYSLAPMLLAVSAGVAVLGASVAQVVDAMALRLGPARALVALLAVAVPGTAGAAQLSRAYAVYHPAYLARASHEPASEEQSLGPLRRWSRTMPANLGPLADRHAWRRIDAILARRNARFGGYLTSFESMSLFMNVAFGFVELRDSVYTTGRHEVTPGACAFWEGPGEGWGPYSAHDVRLRLHQTPTRTCERYRTPWNPRTHRSLCYLCAPGP